MNEGLCLSHKGRKKRKGPTGKGDTFKSHISVICDQLYVREFTAICYYLAVGWCNFPIIDRICGIRAVTGIQYLVIGKK